MAQREPRAWLEEAIGCFNDPEDNGETAWEVRSSLEALRAEAPPGVGPEHRAILETLIAEADAIEEGPYTRARLTEADPPRLELFHHGRDAWIPAEERDKKRAAPPRPTSEGDPKAAWRAFADDTAPSALPELEPTFHQKTGAQLTQLVTALIAKGELPLAEEIARAVLAQHPRFPGHWWDRLGEAQLRRDPPSARATVPRALSFAETGMPSAVSLWFRVEEACGADEETLAVIYVGGRAHGFSLEKPASFGGLGSRRFDKPARAKARFGAMIVPLLEEAWRQAPLEELSALRHFGGMLQRFGKAVPKGLREDVEARLAEAEANED